MSAISLAWVATIKVGNQTAKQLLQFYACHNFNKPGFEFKNDTLANQLEVKVRAIQNAHKLLIEKGFIKKEERFAKDGSQLTSLYYLNIPQSFVDNFFGEGGEGVLKTSPPCFKDTPRGVLKTPLNNNINNKNINKRGESSPKEKSILCPTDFKANDKHKDLGKELGIDVDEEVQKIIDWSHSKHEKRFDWNRAFNNWIRRANKFDKRGQSNAKESSAEIMHRLVKPTVEKIKTQFQDFNTRLDQSVISETRSNLWPKLDE